MCTQSGSSMALTLSITTTLLILLLLCHNGVGKMVARCPVEWQQRGGIDQCYLIHNRGHSRSFTDARSYCRAHGGDLAIVGSAAMRDWLVGAVAETGDVGQDAYMWVGAQLVDDTWKWIEIGVDVDTSVTAFEDTGEGNCAAFTLNGKLIKQDCSQQLKFTCHRNITIPPPCDYDDGWDEMDNYCYKKSEFVDSWHDGLIECKIEGGSLLSIVTLTEQQMATDLAADLHDNVWIGLTEEDHPGEFTWADGEVTNYTNWEDGQPDLSLNGYGAGAVDASDADGRWVVEKVTEEFHFMCKKAQGACLPGWEVFENSCYYFNTEVEDLVVWQDAKSTCEAVGAALVVLDTEQEDAFFYSHIPESDQLWIGLYSKPGDNIYWTDGTTMDSKNFTKMTAQDRTDALSAQDQQCVFFEIGESALTIPTSSWVPTDCLVPRHYACEVPAGTPVILIPPSDERYCPDGWEQNGDHCFLFSTQEMTWTAASSACSSQNAKLVSIHTWTEQDFVHDRQGGGSWLGLNERQSPDAWRWSDGSSLTITNWNVGEPSGNENCVQMLEDTGKWNDFPCDQTLPYTCKMAASTTPIGTITTTTAQPDTSACGWDWTENPVTGECYRLELEELTFADARAVCLEQWYGEGQSSPDLVSLYSSQEQSFVFDLVARQDLSQTGLWIGMMNDIDGNRWMDGTPGAYFNWADGEPSSYYYEENCIEMYSDTGKWNDIDCALRFAFICEKKGRNYVGPQPPPPPEVTCPSGWSYWNNHCYYLSPTTADWDTAHGSCNDLLGSELVSVGSADEDDYLTTLMSSGYINIWMGLHDDDNGANWHWVDGSPFVFTNWYSGEPNNQGGVEHCAEKRSDYWYTWNDMPCSQLNYYVCKINVKTCPQTWTYEKKKCYFASDYEMTWQEARDKCQGFNMEADLVSIHSDDENSFFTELLRHMSDATWLGLKYEDTSAQWGWSDGQLNNYTNWNTGEPNAMDNEWCTEIIDYPNDPSHGKWNNLACTESRAFGCELFPTHTVGCEDGWTNFNGYCYMYSYGDYSNYMSYSKARVACQGLGGDLASIHTAEEEDFLISLLSTFGTFDSVWIGLVDTAHSGEYQWSDGTSVTYTNWDTIDNLYFTSDPFCVSIFLYAEAKWEREDCNTINDYVCKKPQEATPINPSQTGCYEDDGAYKASCYKLLDVKLSWSQAKSACESQGANLLVIDDRYENAFVAAFLGDLDSWVWTGLSAAVDEDGSISFTWVNGDPVDFSNWDEFQPDVSHGTCVVASGKKSNPGLWIVRNCEDTYSYICEYDRSGYTSPPVPTTLSPGAYCAYGWSHQDDRCYQVFSEALPWGRAEELCVSVGGHLASVGSADEETIIQQLAGMSDLQPTYQAVWVGLRLGSESGYEWSDGTALDYVNWAEGQPDSYYGRENCGSADTTSMKLSDSVCEAFLPFVCEAAQGTMVTTLAPPTRGPDILCDDDASWLMYEDHCYKFISEADEDPQDWWGSHKLCRKEGAELVSIHTYDENYWIESKISNLSDNDLWIGGHSKLDSGYDWLDETAFDFDNWAKGEPNNEYDQEDCLSMYNHKQGYWNDYNCAHTLGRICKRLHGQTFPPPVTTKAPDGHCPQGWLHAGTKCILAFSEKMNFTSARSACRNLGYDANLASIHSAAEQAYLTALVGVEQQEVWLGMQYMGEFIWVDQTSVSYTNWASGEPNGGPDWNLCVDVSPATGRWNDVSCSDLYGYVCMMKQDPSLDDHHPPPACSAPYDQYIAYNDGCYRPSNVTKSWQEAESTCVSEGAHLASVHDLAEDAFMWVLAQEISVDDAWIGFNNLQDEQVYRWSDGWPAMYSNWDNGQPNASVSACVRVKSANGRWSAESCDGVRPFICKFYNGTVPTPDPPLTGRCPDSRWLDLGGGYCYLFIKDLKSWSDANMGCLQEAANLASVHSEDEMKLITMTTKNMQFPLWIGLVQKSHGDFGWSDGTGFDFTNWQDGQPSSEEEQCTEVSQTSGLWNDGICSNLRYSICKILKIQDHDPTSNNKPTPAVTTHSPGRGGGGLGAGGVAGIVIAVLFLMAAVSFVGYSFVQKSKKVQQPGILSFSNTLYSADERGQVNMNNTNGISEA
nr:macrophage mannose receptor 1-like isoform X2 [Procambarus clarkii]